MANLVIFYYKIRQIFKTDELFYDVIHSKSPFAVYADTFDCSLFDYSSFDCSTFVIRHSIVRRSKLARNHLAILGINKRMLIIFNE